MKNEHIVLAWDDYIHRWIDNHHGGDVVMVDLFVPVITDKRIKQFIIDTHAIVYGFPPSVYQLFNEQFFFNISYGVSHMVIKDRFVLNLKLMRADIRDDEEFIHAVAMTINHEVFHHIIFETDGDEASLKLDSIFRKYRKQGYWM